MRIVISILIVQFFSISILFSQSHIVRIDGQILGYQGTKKVEYRISPTWGLGNNGSVQPDSLGHFTIQKSIRNIEFFFMYYSDNGVTHKCKLILRPGEYYSFISTGFDSKRWETHYTPDIYTWQKTDSDPLSFFKVHPGQMKFNLIDNGTMGSIYHDEWDIDNPESLIDSLIWKINSQDSVFMSFLIKGLIDEEFYEIAKLNIEYTQAYRLAQTISDTWQLPRRFGIEDSVIINKLYNVYPLIFAKFPVKGVKMEHISGFEKYVDRYLDFREDYKNDIFTPQVRKGAKALEPKLNSKDVLSEEANKIYHMSKTMSSLATYDLGAIKHTKNYLAEYPEMKETPGGKFIEDVLLPNNEEFMKLALKEFSDEMIILDEKTPVTSYDQLLDSLNGKPFLIDYWGTWCSPCRYQFRYTDTLKSFLDNYGIEMVYIALEYETSRDQWEAFIKAYNLTGYHFISNDNFKSDLEKYTGPIVGFPTYIIVDGLGKIVQPKAYFPSQGEKFYNQLEEKLKL